MWRAVTGPPLNPADRIQGPKPRSKRQTRPAACSAKLELIVETTDHQSGIVLASPKLPRSRRWCIPRLNPLNPGSCMGLLPSSQAGMIGGTIRTYPYGQSVLSVSAP